MPSLTIVNTVRRIFSAYGRKQAERTPSPFPKKSPRFSRFTYGLGFSLLTHLSLGLYPHISQPTFETSTQTNMEQELKAMDNPDIEKNKMPDPIKAKYRKILKEYIAKVRPILQQFRNGRSIAVDYANLLIPVEYYWQRTDDNIYLMPKESLADLTRIMQADLTTFSETVKLDISRTDKFKALINLVHSKSVFDPRAHLIPSLLVPEGGQSCQARAQYLLALASFFEKDLLGEGEQFIITKYNEHDALGIFDHKRKTLLLSDELEAGPQTRWTSDLYQPLIFLQHMVDLYDKTNTSYDAFLIAKSNIEGSQAKVEIKGAESPLSFSPPIGSKYSYSGTNVVLEREKANKELQDKRREKILHLNSHADSGVITIELLSDKELEEIERMIIIERESIITSKFFAHHYPDYRISWGKNGNIVDLSLVWLEDIRDADLAMLKGLTDLKGLNLSYTNISDASLAQLKDLTNLEELHLVSTNISDAGLVHLKGLTKLRKLDLSFTQVSNVGLVHLKILTNLQTMYLNNTKISEDQKKELKNKGITVY